VSEPEFDPAAALYAPAVARNRAAVLSALRDVLPTPAAILEIASGSGEHAVHFAAAQPAWRWQPTDVSPRALASIEAHRRQAALDNLAPARRLDVESDWGAAFVNAQLDAIVCINMLHVSPWSAAEGLLRGASVALSAGGRLALYGPFRFAGRFEAPSNASFDRELRERDPAWGVRDEGDLCALASPLGLRHVSRVALPANNHVLVFERG
jgi:hypothetical protein